MPESNDSLEGRLAVVSSDANFPAIQSVLSSPYDLPAGIKDIVQVKTLDKTVFDAFAAIIIAERLQLDSDLLSANLTVPVIYYASDETVLKELNAKPEELAVAKELFLQHKNLFEICNNNTTLFPTIVQAVEAHAKIKTYLEKNANGMKILQRQNPPRFRNALAVANRYEQSLRTLDTLNRELPAHKAMWGTIVQYMLEYDLTGDTELVRKLAPVVFSFLDSYPDYMLDDKAVRVMGEGETGEEPVLFLKDAVHDPSGSSRYTMFREFKPRGDLTAKVIAEQRSRDTKFAGQFKKQFRAPVILRPLNFEDIPDSGRNTSFTVMQNIPGTPLYKILLRVDDAYKTEGDDNKKAKLNLFRKTLLEKYVDDTAFFINKFPNPVGIKKPSPGELIDYYLARIAGIPEALTKRTFISFSDDERLLWSEATKVFCAMKVEPHHIVRNRDTSLANAGLLGISTRQSVDDWLDIFGVTARDRIDYEEVNERFYNFDEQYRYGHVLEDLCQVATFYEASFVFRNKDDRITASNVFKMRERFFDKLENKELVKDLRNDDTTFYLMLVYRAVRKLLLFTDYWERTCKSRDDVRISKNRYDERRARFADNMIHHYLITRTLCHKLSVEMHKQYSTPGIGQYKVLSASTEIDDKRVAECLSTLKENKEGLSEGELNMVRLYSMRALFEKMASFNSRSLKHYYPGMPVQDKPEAP